MALTLANNFASESPFFVGEAASSVGAVACFVCCQNFRGHKLLSFEDPKQSLTLCLLTISPDGQNEANSKKICSCQGRHSLSSWEETKTGCWPWRRQKAPTIPTWNHCAERNPEIPEKHRNSLAKVHISESGQGGRADLEVRPLFPVHRSSSIARSR